MLVGKLGPQEISEQALHDREVNRIADLIELVEHEPYNKAFPEERYSHVVIELKSGELFKSETHTARGDPEAPLSDQEILEKYHAFADPVIGETRAEKVRNVIEEMGTNTHLNDLLELLKLPV